MERLNIRPRGGRVLIEVIFDKSYEDKVVNMDGNGEFMMGSSTIIAPVVEKQEILTPTDRCIIHRFDETKIEDLQEGDTAIFNEKAGTKITHKGKAYLLQNDHDVYAVVENE